VLKDSAAKKKKKIGHEIQAAVGKLDDPWPMLLQDKTAEPCRSSKSTCTSNRSMLPCMCSLSRQFKKANHCLSTTQL